MKSSPFFCKNCGHDLSANKYIPSLDITICNHCHVENTLDDMRKNYIHQILYDTDLSAIKENNRLKEYKIELRRVYHDRMLYEVCIEEYNLH